MRVEVKVSTISVEFKVGFKVWGLGWNYLEINLNTCHIDAFTPNLNFSLKANPITNCLSETMQSWENN